MELAKHRKELEDRIREIEETIREESMVIRETAEAAARYETAVADRERHRKELAGLQREAVRCEHMETEGTCRLLMDGKQAVNGVKAFRIVRVMDVPEEDWATCLCVMDRGADDVRPDNEHEIQHMVLHLWKPVSPGFMTDDGEKVIERYREIGADEFVSLMEKDVRDAYGTIRPSDPE